MLSFTNYPVSDIETSRELLDGRICNFCLEAYKLAVNPDVKSDILNYCIKERHDSFRISSW